MNTLFKYFRKIALVVVLLELVVLAHISTSQAQVIYPPSASLTEGDITSALIKDGEIIDADFSDEARIEASRIRGGGTIGQGFFSGGDTIATSSLFNISTSTDSVGISTTTPAATLGVEGDLFVDGGIVAADLTATNTIGLGGVTYTPPAGDGTADQVLSTDGAGTLAWASVGGFAFGGNSADGALDTSSAPVEIDLGSTTPAVKNFSSINIATNGLSFTNATTSGPVIILKSAGACTITDTIDLTGLGSAGGSAGASGGGSGGKSGGGGGGSAVNDGGNPPQADTTAGADGGDGVAFNELTFGLGTTTITGGRGGTNGVTHLKGVEAQLPRKNSVSYLTSRALVVPGAGGGGGTGSTTGVGGVGGNGGGALYMECAGALNFTGTIDASGADGGASANAGGGGGGGGGSVQIIFDTLTANSGTCTVDGGAAGSGAAGNNGGVGGKGVCSIGADVFFE